MSGRPSEKRYQLAAQKRHEEALKIDYYNQTARYFERESGKARKFNTWNVDELKSTKLDNKKKLEALKTRQNKLRELFNYENELFDREKKQLESRPSTKKEFTLEELRKKLQEKRTEQSLYNPQTFRRIQSYFPSQKNTAERRVLTDTSSNQLTANNSINKSSRTSENTMNTIKANESTMKSSSDLNDLNCRMSRFEMHAQQSEEQNRETSQGSSRPHSAHSTSISPSNRRASEGSSIVRQQNAKPDHTPEKRHFLYGNQTIPGEKSSSRSSSEKRENNLHYTAAFDTRAHEFKDNQNAGEGSSIGFYQDNEQTNNGNLDRNKQNDLHNTVSFDTRTQESKDNRMSNESSSIVRQLNAEPEYKSEKRHFLYGNQTIPGENSSSRSSSEKVENNLHYTEAFDIRAKECKNNQTASEASSISFVDKSYVEHKTRSRGGSDKRNFYGDDQEDAREFQQVEIEKIHYDQSDNGTSSSNRKNELDIRTREYKSNQAAGEGSNFTFGSEKSQFSKEQLRRGSGSSESSTSSSRKSLENNFSIGQRDDETSDWQPKNKYADRYKRRSLQDTNVSDTAGSREATPPLTSDEKSHYGENDEVFVRENQNLITNQTPVRNVIDSRDKKDNEQQRDETDKSLNYEGNNSRPMLAYVTYTKLKSDIMDLEKRESRAVIKQEWEDALRLREMRNNLELLREKRMWEYLGDVDSHTRKQAFNTIQQRSDLLARRDKFYKNTEMYSEEAKLTWKKWDREDQGSSSISAEKYREKLLGKLEEEWQELADTEKTKISEIFDKTMASTFQHEMCLLSKLTRR